MAEFPALPLFTDAYLADTRHLDATQHGAYLLLLMTAWRTATCSLPDDDATLAKWACMDRRTWARHKPVIMAFWTLTDTGWVQKRLLDERKHVEHVRSKNVQAGRASALKRLNRGSTSVQPKANQTSTPIPIPIPIPSVVSNDTTQPREALEALEHQLREAAGWQREPAPMLCVTGEVQALIDAGAILETDVLPVVRALAPKARNRTSWKFFIPAIVQARDDRLAASTRVSPPSPTGPAINGSHQQQPSKRQQGFAILDAIVAEAYRRENGGSDGGSEDNSSGPPGNIQ